MKTRTIILILFVVVVFTSASATIINIPDDYSTIQAGIDASTNGDTVLVQPGTYVENINFNGHNIVLGSLFLTTGDTSYISQTVIDGDSSGSVVTFESGEDSTTIITGFTIQNGFAQFGGGIYCIEYSNPTIIYNKIAENSGPYMGIAGGITCFYSDPTINYNIISQNYPQDHGGGIYCGSSNPIITNNTISGNSSPGVQCVDSNPLLRNTIIWGNPTHEAIYIHNSVPIVLYCDIEGGWPGEGNIDVDPLFRDPENGDFHLMAIECGDSVDSPCIDAGHPDILDSLLDCDWGLGTILSDMGAYGGGDSVEVGIKNPISQLPKRFTLSQNYPNPFNPSTTITFSLPKQQHVTIKIYDLLGREVQTLINEQRQVGKHAVRFDASGLSSGIYFYRLQAGDYSESKRMVLLK